MQLRALAIGICLAIVAVLTNGDIDNSKRSGTVYSSFEDSRCPDSRGGFVTGYAWKEFSGGSFQVDDTGAIVRINNFRYESQIWWALVSSRGNNLGNHFPNPDQAITVYFDPPVLRASFGYAAAEIIFRVYDVDGNLLHAYRPPGNFNGGLFDFDTDFVEIENPDGLIGSVRINSGVGVYGDAHLTGNIFNQPGQPGIADMVATYCGRPLLSSSTPAPTRPAPMTPAPTRPAQMTPAPTTLASTTPTPTTPTPTTFVPRPIPIARNCSRQILFAIDTSVPSGIAGTASRPSQVLSNPIYEYLADMLNELFRFSEPVRPTANVVFFGNDQVTPLDFPTIHLGENRRRIGFAFLKSSTALTTIGRSFLRLFDREGRVGQFINKSENPTVILVSSGFQREEESELLCDNVQALRQENQNLEVICLQTGPDSVQMRGFSNQATLKCACDRVLNIDSSSTSPFRTIWPTSIVTSIICQAF